MIRLDGVLVVCASLTSVSCVLGELKMDDAAETNTLEEAEAEVVADRISGFA